jgi:hypothetical protein
MDEMSVKLNFDGPKEDAVHMFERASHGFAMKGDTYDQRASEAWHTSGGVPYSLPMLPSSFTSATSRVGIGGGGGMGVGDVGMDHHHHHHPMLMDPSLVTATDHPAIQAAAAAAFVVAQQWNDDIDNVDADLHRVSGSGEGDGAGGLELTPPLTSIQSRRSPLRYRTTTSTTQPTIPSSRMSISPLPSLPSSSTSTSPSPSSSTLRGRSPGRTRDLSPQKGCVPSTSIYYLLPFST